MYRKSNKIKEVKLRLLELQEKNETLKAHYEALKEVLFKKKPGVKNSRG